MSKGSKPRPLSISYDEYTKRWDKIFGDKTFECNKSHIPNTKTRKALEDTTTLLKDESLNVELEKIKK